MLPWMSLFKIVCGKILHFSWLHGNSVWYFEKLAKYLLKKLHHFTVPLPVCKSSNFSTCLSTLVTVCLFCHCCSGRCQVIICGFDLHFNMAKDTEHLTICISPWRKCHWNTLPIFNWMMCLYYWVVIVLYIFWL